ncbi:hypothetical protein [Streptomyces sp. NPDC091027]|uniref:hypothetical protein n=1 Tax=Streptomyces sp. NPDC091027 TaxID=3365971 RepID=UPI00381E1E5F
MEQLGELASEKPLVALKALADLQHLIPQTSQEAASMGMPRSAISCGTRCAVAAALLDASIARRVSSSPSTHRRWIDGCGAGTPSRPR